jgi:hypothetical protein
VQQNSIAANRQSGNRQSGQSARRQAANRNQSRKIPPRKRRKGRKREREKERERKREREKEKDVWVVVDLGQKLATLQKEWKRVRNATFVFKTLTVRFPKPSYFNISFWRTFFSTSLGHLFYAIILRNNDYDH